MSRRQSKRPMGIFWKQMVIIGITKEKTGRLDCYFVLDSVNKEKEHIKNIGEYMLIIFRFV